MSKLPSKNPLLTEALPSDLVEITRAGVETFKQNYSEFKGFLPKGIGEADQQVNISGFRALKFGGNTGSDGLVMQNFAGVNQHEFNAEGDYRMLTGHLVTGGGLPSNNYGQAFNKTGTVANIYSSSNVVGGRCLYLLKTGSGGVNALMSNLSSSGIATCLEVLGSGSAVTKTGVKIDVSGAANNYAIDLVQGDIKTPSGIGYTGTLTFNAVNTGDTATATYDKGVLISTTTL